MKTLKDKIAFVTGGSRGIGAGIAKKLAEEGANVIITYNNNSLFANQVVSSIQDNGGKAFAIKIDLTSPNEVEIQLKNIIEEYRKIDILVNNAGYMDTSGTSTDKVSLDVIDNTINTNVRGSFLITQKLMNHISSGGRVINIASCLNEYVPGPNLTLYTMSKSAISGFTKGLARDLGSRGITVNQISPGPIDTDMNPSNGPSSDFQKNLTVIGKYGKPQDIAEMVSFLCSDKADFITGSNIAVDGGTNI